MARTPVLVPAGKSSEIFVKLNFAFLAADTPFNVCGLFSISLNCTTCLILELKNKLGATPQFASGPYNLRPGRNVGILE
jgi:hypothetical protein